MIDVYPEFQNDSSLRKLISSQTLVQITEALGQFWQPPHEMRARIMRVISQVDKDSLFDVVVSGETKNISLYVIGSRGVLAVNPFSMIDSNILLREVYGEGHLPKNCAWYIFPADVQLLRRLSLPKVLLVNPCVLENFPIPRLSLSVGLLGSYLRKFQKADVRIVDMQVGATVSDVVDEAMRLAPALVGMSISYGQKHVAISILEGLYQAKRKHLIDPLIVLGNIIPASFPLEFIKMYPDLVVACGEGEQTVLGLAEYLVGERTLADIPGIAYQNGSGQFQRTPNAPVPVQSIPLPALDTITDIARCKGALTIELSRGCQWNVCTFCPREHKSSTWKTFSTPQTLEQFGYLAEICERFGLPKRVFLADEEFIGGMNDGKESERIINLARGLLSSNLRLSFDAAARVDQVYSPKMDREWHVKRMEMWHLCSRAGLDRLFMGIESGSNTQLQRFGKGIKSEHSIIAIRILSALGIPLRFGFITFDQLMIGLTEIKENITFLERTDAFMRRVDVEAYGYERLFDLLVNDKDFVAVHSANKPVAAGISYMLASMEVLINSRYRIMLKQAERRYGKKLIHDEDAPDTNMGRYRVEFVDDLIRDISVSSQRWIDRHFGVAYSVKSLYKVASRLEKEYLMAWMVHYRQISLLLLKALVYLFDQGNEEAVRFQEIMAPIHEPSLADQIELMRSSVEYSAYLDRLQLIEGCMNSFDHLVACENKHLESLLATGAITDAQDEQLHKALARWRERKGKWTLINGPNMANEKSYMSANLT